MVYLTGNKWSIFGQILITIYITAFAKLNTRSYEMETNLLRWTGSSPRVDIHFKEFSLLEENGLTRIR
jgi:hypothetical protein